MHAEQAYIFRHVLLRDSAYQLQLPGDRARLHAMALDILEGLANSENLQRALALELADHARAAQAGAPPKRKAALQLRELGHLRHGLNHAGDNWRHLEAVALARRVRELSCASPHDRDIAQGFIVSSLIILGRYDEAKVAADEGMKEAQDSNNTSGLGAYLFNACLIARETGNDAEFDRHTRELLDLSAQSPGSLQHARALKARGSYFKQLKHYEECLDLSNAALEIFEKLGIEREFAGMLMDRSIALKGLGRIDECDRDLDRATKLCEANNDQFRLTQILLNRALYAMSDKPPQAALAYAQAALEAATKAASNNMAVQALSRMAAIHEGMGQEGFALNLRFRAADMARQDAPAPVRVDILIKLAESLKRQGRHNEARAALKEAEALGAGRLAPDPSRLQELRKALA